MLGIKLWPRTSTLVKQNNVLIVLHHYENQTYNANVSLSWRRSAGISI